MIAFDYGDWRALSVDPKMPEIMFDEFRKLAIFWSDGRRVPALPPAASTD